MTTLGALGGESGLGGRLGDRTGQARLVPAALTVWLGTAAGLLLAWWCALLAGLLAMGCAAGWLLRHRGGQAAVVVLLCAGVFTAGWVAFALRAEATSPLRAAAADNADASLRVELTNRPKPIYDKGAEGGQDTARWLLVQANARAARVDGRAIPGGGAVLLFTPVDGWRDLLIGQAVTVEGTLEPARDDDGTLAVMRVRGPPRQLGAPGFGQRQAEVLRAGLRQHSRALGSDAGALLPGLVDGDTSGIPPRLTTDFRTTGLSHLTAVSGSNLAIVCGAVLLTLRALRAGPWISALLAGAALAGFVLLAGPDPSVLRAAVMGAIALLALAVGRPRAALPALATAVLVLVALDPAMAVNLGFTLSVLATAALVLLAPRWTAALTRWRIPTRIAQALVVPAAAHVATAPVIAGISGQVSLVAIGANLVTGPVVAPATVFGVLAAVTAPFAPWLADACVWLAGPEARWIVTVGTTGAHLPAAAFDWPAGWLGALLLAAVFAVVVVALRYRRPRVVVLIAVLALALFTVPRQWFRPGWPPTNWAMTSCDVGQGDSEVLATSEPGTAVLVDAGPDNEAVGDCLRHLGVQRVSMVLISHLHDDHYGGLHTVLEHWPVGAVGVGPAHEPASGWHTVTAAAANAHVPVLGVHAGQRLTWPGLRVDVLGPLPAETTPASDDGSDINNTSLVLRATTGAGRELLTGDMEPEAQQDLLDSGVDVRADVLKIPHHGSRSQDPDFLAAVHARLAIASVGAGNDYGHPNRTTMTTLRGDGAATLRTDHAGDIAVVPGRTRAAGPLTVLRGDPRPAPR